MGMVFNVSLATKPGAFVHNPFLIEQLLITTISQMQTQYGITPSVCLSADAAAPAASADQQPLRPDVQVGVSR